jgi:hypothetical protein
MEEIFFLSIVLFKAFYPLYMDLLESAGFAIKG